MITFAKIIVTGGRYVEILYRLVTGCANWHFIFDLVG